jgi:hypothetical protein
MTSPTRFERRLLQATVAILCVVPLAAGGAGVLFGPGMIASVAGAPVALDSHFRYLSGLLLGLGLVFLSCVPSIERKTARFRLAAVPVVCGGLARAASLAVMGVPTPWHLVGLAIELGAVPLLLLWQARHAR